MRRIGVVVNPIAGMGGRVGLKGTDGKVEEARNRGAEPRAPERARDALRSLYAADRSVELFAYGGVMGADHARAVGFEPTVVGHPDGGTTDAEDSDAVSAGTTAADTRDAVREFLDRDVDLILFVGGDGTAVDVVETLDERGADTPILGVPAGVKVYSAVFAVSPQAAGRTAARFTDTAEAEVNDVDEDAFRGGEVRTELRGVATVPQAEQRQSAKQLGGGTVETLAAAVAEEVREGVTYVLGPGSTVGAIKAELGFDGTPLGVDVYRDGRPVAIDAGEREILDELGDENVIVVSPIGGQGFVFGRGNQQISPAVVRRSAVEIVASREKLDGIGVLRVDTGDTDLDAELAGWTRVRVGKFERRMVRIVAATADGS